MIFQVFSYVVIYKVNFFFSVYKNVLLPTNGLHMLHLKLLHDRSGRDVDPPVILPTMTFNY